MSRLVKGVGLFLCIFAVVWIAVLWRWNSTARSIGWADIVIYLGMLPLVVFGVLTGLSWAWKSAPPRHEAARAEAEARRHATTPATAAAALATTDEKARLAALALLSAHVTCAAGETASALLEAVSQGEPRPQFLNALRDADGLAVMCAQVADLRTETVEEGLEPVVRMLQGQRPEWAAVEPGEQVLRALAALAEPLKSALHDLQPWAERLGAPPRGGPSDSADPGAPNADRALLRLVLGWPTEWSEFEREAATAWARLQLAEHTEVPATRCSVVTHALSGPELWLQVEQLAQTLHREGRQDLLLVAAAHCDVSAAGVLQLETAQRLFSAARRPRGVVPGEAAAALLLAAEGWPANPTAWSAPVRLHRGAVLRRDKSVEASGRISSQTLQDATRQALQAARMEADSLTAAVGDGDQHSARGPELFGALLAVTPQLDAQVDVAVTGTLSGHVGAVNTLLVVAAAAQRARDVGQPCLALSLADPFLRLALLARPDAPEPVAA